MPIKNSIFALAPEPGGAAMYGIGTSWQADKLAHKGRKSFLDFLNSSAHKDIPQKKKLFSSHKKRNTTNV